MLRIFFIVLLFTGLSLNAQETFSLKVKVNDLRDSKGVVQFTLYNSDGTIPDEHFKKYYKKQLANIHNKSASIIFTNLPKGRYVVNILHDENQNGKIDKGYFLPIEGVGFSNYKSIGLLNIPNFKKASFELDENKEISIHIIYF